MRLTMTIAMMTALAVGGSCFAAATATHTAAAARAVHTGPWIDAQGKCRQANGQMATMTVCKPPAATQTAGSAPKCVTGKLCGKSCIPKTAVCHQ